MDAARATYRSARPATSSGCSAAVIDRAYSAADTIHRRSSQSGAFAAFAAETVLKASCLGGDAAYSFVRESRLATDQPCPDCGHRERAPPLRRGRRCDLRMAMPTLRARFALLNSVHVVAQLGDGLIDRPSDAVDRAQGAMLRQRVPGRERQVLAEPIALGGCELLPRDRDRGHFEEGGINSFHSAREFSTSMAGDVRGCTRKSKRASRASSCLIIVSRKKRGIGSGGMVAATGGRDGRAEFDRLLARRVAQAKRNRGPVAGFEWARDCRRGHRFCDLRALKADGQDHL